MKTLRRIDIRECLYFITVCTLKKGEYLLLEPGIFWESWPLPKPEAWVILPDHFHLIVSSGENGISDLMHDFKIKYSIRYRFRYRTGRIWQHRFWDHIIRDQDDLNRHIDYIHYNPVKHGLIDSPFLYEHSSIHEYHRQGYYERDWGSRPIEYNPVDFGE
jgi:putative transposase